MGAAFDSRERYPPPRCFRGTREDILAKISSWIDDAEAHQVCWLFGVAGAGKSAIAQTVADNSSIQKKLAASFFFSRGNASRSTAASFFTTIAYQLSISVPMSREVILRAIQEDPSIPTKDLRRQLQKLIVDPLRMLEETITTPVVVVIDAINECEDSILVEEIIFLAEELRKHDLPLRLFVTSRRDPRIQAKTSGPNAHLLVRCFDLQDFVAKDDIRLFFEIRFADILDSHSRDMRNAPSPWPPPDDIDKLVAKSSGLFIFASTILKFIDDDDDGPNQQLNTVLRMGFGSDAQAMVKLDQFYRDIFIESSYTERARRIVGTITLLFDPLSLFDLERLLVLRSGDGWRALRKLHSVLIVPDEEDRPVRIFHASLLDFLMTHERSEEYYVDPLVHHGNIARACLEFMVANLHRDMGEMEDPLDRKVDNHCQRPKDICGALRYASQYWAVHLSRASFSTDIFEAVDNFAFKSLLHWIEALSLMGNLQNALSSLQSASRWLMGHSHPRTNLLALLQDAQTMMSDFFHPISSSPMHVYYTALPLTLPDTVLYDTYVHELLCTEQKLSTLLKRVRTALS